MPTAKQRRNPAKKQAPHVSAANSHVVGLDAFFTRERANTGTRVDLVTPEGASTPHYLIVRGLDSDEFQAAKSTQLRTMTNIAQLPEAERPEAAAIGLCELLAVLVKDWSFHDINLMPPGAEPYPCTHANVVKLLREAPQIRDQIDSLVSRREVFFTMPSKV